MGRRATGTVEPLRESIRLKFTWLGKRRVETLNLAPTPANIKAAERTLAKIVSAIEAGVYRREDYFEGKGPKTKEGFAEYADAWVETLTVEASTKAAYIAALNSTWKPAFDGRALAEIRHSDVKKAVADKVKSGVSGKTVNNYLTPLRKVFEAAVKDDLIPKDPADGVTSVGYQKPEPDPFTQGERDMILAHLKQRYDEQVWNYYTFAFDTGVRPSEQIALGWPDIDWVRQKARISRARVRRQVKGTKTNQVREIDLSDAAMAALTRQKAHTFMKDQDGPVFHNPRTAKPWHDERDQRRLYFKPTLTALGLRQRDAYQTRHTYASTLLMGGSNVAYISKQLGHSNIATTLNKYARWIEGADKGSEAAKMREILSGKAAAGREKQA